MPDKIFYFYIFFDFAVFSAYYYLTSLPSSVQTVLPTGSQENMTASTPRRFRILITITVLFTSLIVAFGLVFRQFIYWQTSSMLKDGSQRHFTQITRELSLDYLGVHKAVAQTVHIIGQTSITEAMALEQRLLQVAIFQAAIKEEPHLTGLQVGYGNGDYFIVRPLNNDYMRVRFHAPEKADYVVDNISTGPDNRKYLQRIWYSSTLSEIARAQRVPTEYDPRVRPWYIKAQKRPGEEIATEPYLFHFIGQMGLTIAYKVAGLDVVVAGDIPLHYLSKTVAKYQTSPRSELILVEKKDRSYLVAAYRDADKLINSSTGALQRAKIDDLHSTVLSFASKQKQFLSSFYDFAFEQEKWFGSAIKLDIPNNENLFLVQLSPEKELLVEAHRMQDQALKYTLAMILLTIPVTWLLARKISRPMQDLAKETKRISHFEFGTTQVKGSFIKEVDELARAMSMMEQTIERFISLISSLASEQDFDKLLSRITGETMIISGADAAFAYLLADASHSIKPASVQTRDQVILSTDILPVIDTGSESRLVKILFTGKRTIIPLSDFPKLQSLSEKLGLEDANVVAIPLCNRQKEPIGMLCLLYNSNQDILSATQAGRIAFTEALSGFAAVTLESRKMLRMQKKLLASFVKLLAGAIDSKSPYTGGHCMRVPEITKLLARKACEADTGPFAEFTLSDEQWEALHIASWLHDCGKVTTPEFVVDKATKLECIYDRIHEIRMRFEVLKRDAHLNYWQKLAEGGAQQQLLNELHEEWRKLDEDFYFIADCNIGGEFMATDKIDRLEQISSRSWMRTIDDRQGISWEEMQRKSSSPESSLPVREQVLADKQEHLIPRAAKQQIAKENEYGFILETPEHLFNRGELYNLKITRGTLTTEERYIINDHIVQTIIMLSQLPYPKHLQNVPEIAGGHHEKIDGTGYPRRLKGEQMSVQARIMVIADIYEALTASDRPYKQGKNLEQVLVIMNNMKNSGHIDPDLFRLFLSSGAYLEYARKHLQPGQLVEVDISSYLA